MPNAFSCLFLRHLNLIEDRNEDKSASIRVIGDEIGDNSADRRRKRRQNDFKLTDWSHERRQISHTN